MPNVTYNRASSPAFADLLDRRPAHAARDKVEAKKVCAFCGREYQPWPHEKAERQCCHENPKCETAWELAKNRSRQRTPRPVLTAEPPRPLRTGNS